MKRSAMNALEVAQQYFDAWNRRDPAAVLATLAPGGTYSDPSTGGPLSGDAFVTYMKGLFAAFPDVSFEIASVGLAAPDWRRRVHGCLRRRSRQHVVGALPVVSDHD